MMNAHAQDVLPFPDPPMGGKVGPTMQESVHKWRTEPSRLPADAPNILIVMFDDAGFGQASTFGGEIETPTLTRLANEGIAYNRFHTTAMSSPTRASLMTGRNHHRVGAGIIAEFANDWDGYSGVIPKSSATIAEVLRYYGYATSAYGKDHNTPIDQTANGPYDRTPTGRGLRLFLWFHSGRDLPVGTYAVGEHDPDLTAACGELRGLPPDRGHGRQGHHLDAASPRREFGSAVPHVLDAGRRTWSPSRGEGMGGQVQGQVRRRLGRLPGRGFSSGRKQWAGSRPTRSGRLDPRACPHGRTSPRTKRPSRRA